MKPFSLTSLARPSGSSVGKGSGAVQRELRMLISKAEKDRGKLMPLMKKEAFYKLGAELALQAVGLLKQASLWTHVTPTLLGAGAGAMLAGPENRMRGALIGGGAGLGGGLMWSRMSQAGRAASAAGRDYQAATTAATRAGKAGKAGKAGAGISSHINLTPAQQAARQEMLHFGNKALGYGALGIGGGAAAGYAGARALPADLGGGGMFGLQPGQYPPGY